MKITVCPTGQIGANFYLVCDEVTNQAFAIDPGFDGDKLAQIIKQSKADLKYITITHAHADHICALDRLKSEFDAKVVVGKLDSDAINDDDLSLCTAFGCKAPKTICDIAVSDEDTLPFANDSLKILHTPGHTRGGICILCGDALFTGDTLFNMSIGRTDFVGGDFGQIIDSIKNKIFTLDDQVTIYPGHGDSSTVGYEKENNPYC